MAEAREACSSASRQAGIERRAVVARVARRRLPEVKQELLQVAVRQIGLAVAIGQRLPLLGEAQPRADGAGGQAGDGAPGAAAAARGGGAAPMKEPDLHVEGARRRGDRLLRLVERPVGGQKPGVLVRVGVADHHLQAVATAHVREKERVVEQAGDGGAGPVSRSASVSNSGTTSNGSGAFGR